MCSLPRPAPMPVLGDRRGVRVVVEPDRQPELLAHAGRAGRCPASGTFTDAPTRAGALVDQRRNPEAERDHGRPALSSDDRVLDLRRRARPGVETAPWPARPVPRGRRPRPRGRGELRPAEVDAMTGGRAISAAGTIAAGSCAGEREALQRVYRGGRTKRRSRAAGRSSAAARTRDRGRRRAAKRAQAEDEARRLEEMAPLEPRSSLIALVVIVLFVTRLGGARLPRVQPRRQGGEQAAAENRPQRRSRPTRARCSRTRRTS